jgi:hypothetical protein
MKFISQRLKYVIAAPLFLVASLVLSFSHIDFASAAVSWDMVWDGSAGDRKFSTAANWSTNAAPVDGDIIAFAALSGESNVALINDLTGVSLGGLFIVKALSSYSTSFQLDTVTFEDGATISSSGTGSAGVTAFLFSNADYSPGTVIGEGDLTVNADTAFPITDNTNIAGNLTVSGSATFSIVGTPVALGDIIYTSSASGYSGLHESSAENMTLDEITLYSRGSTCAPGKGGVGNCSEYNPITYTLSGNITLNGNVYFSIASGVTVNITGTVTENGHTIGKAPGTDTGILIVNGETVGGTERTVVGLSDDLPDTNVTVSNYQDAVLSGSRGIVTVESDATLKGSGVAETLITESGASVNPGNSPGTLTVLSDLNATDGGEYYFEILDTDSYDQLIVGEDYEGGGNAVTLGTEAGINPILYDGWSIEEGDQFTVIDNLSDTAVSGTFRNYAEGTQFTVEDDDVSITFSITYEGGDGNDIVLTALNDGSDPTPPNTGVAKLILANPAIVAVLGLITAGLLALVIFRRRAAN